MPYSVRPGRGRRATPLFAEESMEQRTQTPPETGCSTSAFLWHPYSVVYDARALTLHLNDTYVCAGAPGQVMGAVMPPRPAGEHSGPYTVGHDIRGVVNAWASSQRLRILKRHHGVIDPESMNIFIIDYIMQSRGGEVFIAALYCASKRGGRFQEDMADYIRCVAGVCNRHMGFFPTPMVMCVYSESTPRVHSCRLKHCPQAVSLPPPAPPQGTGRAPALPYVLSPAGFIVMQGSGADGAARGDERTYLVQEGNRLPVVVPPCEDHPAQEELPGDRPVSQATQHLDPVPGAGGVQGREGQVGVAVPYPQACHGGGHQGLPQPGQGPHVGGAIFPGAVEEEQELVHGDRDPPGRDGGRQRGLVLAQPSYPIDARDAEGHAQEAAPLPLGDHGHEGLEDHPSGHAHPL